ncbi:MAG: fructose-6-phosphate aldolase [Kiritimatiellaeota bacterium]|nr:fructose-6-phosphate aldolase [Kiritimatiellota bacterium]
MSSTPFRFFLDTAEIAEIKDAVATGLVHGIATNPNKIAKSGKSYQAVLAEIREFFDGPIAFQALGRTVEELEAHALDIHAMDPNLAVKVTANQVGLTAIPRLVAEGVRTNATLIFNPTQALLAGLAGSPFISPFVGRARMTGQDGIAAIATIRRLYDTWGIDNTVIIGASIKDVEQVIQVILAGAHSVAVPFNVFQAMMEHPLTDRGLETFLDEFSRTSAAPE